ncbi:MAG: hypothetical protein O7B26_13195 [Planctomycetota bacterium]|nr:hypothetical protein [Planctomycetota bacterium]
MTRRLTVLILISFACLPGCGFLEVFILRPSSEINSTPADFGFAADKMRLALPDGGEISIWHVRTTEEKKGILIVVPGNDANKSRYTTGLPLFVDDGWDLILMDYQGFGESSGTATFDGLIASTRVVMEYALSQDEVVVGYGVSLGTSVLARVAADFDLTACIFESTTDIWAEASLFLSHHLFASPVWLPLDAIAALGSTEDFDLKRWITQVEEPKLFIHAPGDNITPFAGAWEVFQLAPQPKHMFVTQGDHALQLFLDPVLYRTVVNGWLNGVLQNDPILNEQFQQFLEEQVQASLEGLGFARGKAPDVFFVSSP